jgi:hypothetical protein
MRILYIFIKLLLSFVLSVIFIPYIISPAYRFEDPVAFTGDSFYNPYNNWQNNNYYKANFHYHSNAWGFLTDGRGETNTSENILKQYAAYGYDIAGISNYMRTDPLSPIPLYEHGTGIKKTHQLVAGSDAVMWLDFILAFKTSHKQFILNLLKTDSNLIVLNHPSWHNAYTFEDIKLLGNYDCMEVLSTNKESLPLWDTALTAGKMVFMMVNDDGHDVNNPEVTGRIFNMIAAEDKNMNSVFDALTKGSAVGYEFPHTGDTIAIAGFHSALILPESVVVDSDTVIFTFREKLKSIRLMGDRGKELMVVSDSSVVKYRMQQSDTYVRCEAMMYNGTRIIMNPVIRGEYIENSFKGEVLILKTILLSVPVAVIWLFLMVMIWRRRKKRK